MIIGSASKQFLGNLNLVKSKAVLEALEHPGEVVRYSFSVEKARNVIRQPLKRGAGVDKHLAV